jgi:PEP-CTERM motif
MMRWKLWVAGVGLCVAGAPAAALDVLLNFEGFNQEAPLNSTEIDQYYNNGNSFPPPPSTGPDFGVRFLLGSPNVGAVDSGGAVAPSPAVVYRTGVDGFPTFGFVALNGVPVAPDPHPLTGSLGVMDSGGGRISVFGNESFAVMTSARGIDLSTLSFLYSSDQVDGARVEAIDSFGGVIGLPFVLASQSTDRCQDPDFCNWTRVNWGGKDTAYSLRFYNDSEAGTRTLYDNIEFNYAVAVPEPSTYALMALGLAAVALGSRRRRERIASA